MANCEQYWDLISGSLDGALTQEEQQRLDRHLAQCPQCRALWQQLSELGPELMELETPPADFADRVMAQAAQTEQDIPFTNLPQDRKPGKEARKQLNAWWKPVRNLVLVAACCLVILGLGRFAAQMFSVGSAGSSTGNGTAAQDTAAGSQQSTAAAPEAGEAAGSSGAAAEEQASSAGTTAGSAAADGGSLSTAEGAPGLALSGGSYFLTDETSPNLPQGFAATGTLTEDQAGDSGFVGYDYYTSPDQPDRCWVYVPEEDAYLLFVREES